MPYLDKIVNAVNDSLVKTSLSGKVFQGGLFYGIAKQVRTTSDNNNGEPVYSSKPVGYVNEKETNLSPNDKYPIQVYHRCLQLTYAVEDKAKSFGNGNRIVTERAQMLMIVFADPKQIKISQEDLAFKINMGLPSKFKVTDVACDYIDIIPSITNTNSIQVYQGEYQLAEYPLKPQSIYFSVSYGIETQSDRNCLSCTDC